MVKVAMKTAISLPDPVFEEAESLARQLGVSRSELYTKALKAYLRKYNR
ncbi:MAG: ribbon-helix-helix domain-containing protein, partial [Dolichospermum sp.]